MSWFVVALVPPLVWSISSYLDKYLIARYFRRGAVGSLLIFSGLIGVAVASFVLLVHPDVVSIGPLSALLALLGGVVYVLAYLPYLRALEHDETSTVGTLFQTIPIFSFGLAFLALGETITFSQVLSSALILGGGTWLSVSGPARSRLGPRTLGLMLLSSFMLALSALVFKFVALGESYWVTMFWESVGYVVTGLGLLAFVPTYRRQFAQVLKQNRTAVIGLNVLNETVNIVGVMVAAYATLLAPLVLVGVVGGLQPLFLLLLGGLGTLLLPKIFREDFSLLRLAAKVPAMLVIILGVYLLNML